jgi:hypothetical protein
VAAQGGARTGHVFRNGISNHDELAWAGHFAVSLEDTLTVGFEVEGRAEHEQGSLFTAGLQGGLSTACATCRVNFAGHADFGIPLAWTNAGGVYAGATLELPIRLDTPPPTAERNRNFRVLGTRPALVPFMRHRFYRLRADGAGHETMHDLAIGTALRVAFETDLL